MARVGRICQAGDEARIGVLVVTLMGLLSRALAAGECASELDGKCVIEERAAEGYGFMIATVMVLLVVWALGFCVGWVVFDLMRTRPRLTIRTTTTTTTTRTVSTQSPVTYGWRRITPRFLPLSADRHGAWSE